MSEARRLLLAFALLAVLLVGAPFVFRTGVALTMMSLMGVMIIFALSYNMLLGQTGLLSFGHAVYYGLAGFCAAHAMNIIAANKLSVVLPAIPLVGAAAGLFFGLIFGAISTRKAGTVFSMISLGLGELVTAFALVLHSFFGGEEGIATNRVKLAPFFGYKFGPQIQVYYLIAFWCFVCILLMYALTRTPFGRLCNAVRDNPERVEFIGFSTQRVRFQAFVLSSVFAGIAGSLAAINFELMNSQAIGAGTSGQVLLMTFVGGIGHFAGPIIGAVLITFLQISLSDVTKAWMLYFGLLFIVVVMFCPGGIAGLLALHRPLLNRGRTPAPDSGLWTCFGAAGRACPGRHRPDRARPPHAGRGADRRPDAVGVPCANGRRAAPALACRARAFDGRRARLARRRAEDRRRLCAGGGRTERGGCAMTPAVSLKNIRKNFGRTEIIRGVTLDIMPGERHAIIGPNGAGKSTLFHLISGRLAVTSGSIELKGENITHLAPYEINRRGLSRSFQVTNIFPKLSVYENIRCALLWSLGYRYSFWRFVDRLKDANKRAHEITEMIGLSARRDVPAGVLAYAEQRALEIGITLAGGADVIMLDEPTAGMSKGETEHAVALIRRVSEGRTLIMVEHDMSVVFGLADRISVLVYGQIIASDKPQEIRANQAVREAYLGEEANA